MIELFSLVKSQREKSIKIKCDNVLYWRSESRKINELIDYIKAHENKFFVDKMDITYARDCADERYVKSFDLSIWTDTDTYNFLKDKYGSLFEKYCKHIIKLDDIKFQAICNSDFSRLRIH